MLLRINSDLVTPILWAILFIFCSNSESKRRVIIFSPLFNIILIVIRGGEMLNKGTGH